MVKMKAWKNSVENWCFEFESDEHEAMRFCAIVSAGVRNYKERRDKFPIGFINATLFYRAISVIFVGSNYTGDFGTVDKPLIHRAKEMAESVLRRDISDDLNEHELQILKENIDDIKNIL